MLASDADGHFVEPLDLFARRGSRAKVSIERLTSRLASVSQ